MNQSTVINNHRTLIMDEEFDFDNEFKRSQSKQTNPTGVNIIHEEAEPNGTVNNNLGEVVPVKCTNAGKLRKPEYCDFSVFKHDQIREENLPAVGWYM